MWPCPSTLRPKPLIWPRFSFRLAQTLPSQAQTPLNTRRRGSSVGSDWCKRFCLARHLRDWQKSCINDVLAINPDLILDDGADLTVTLASENRPTKVQAITEETTSGLKRLRALAAEGKLPAPVIAVNDAQSKSLFDNRYGTGQSSWDGILRTTNLTVCGKNVVIGVFRLVRQRFGTTCSVVSAQT